MLTVTYLVLIYVDLDEDAVGKFIRHFDERRADALARATPCRGEVHAHELWQDHPGNLNVSELAVRTRAVWRGAAHMLAFPEHPSPVVGGLVQDRGH